MYLCQLLKWIFFHWTATGRFGSAWDTCQAKSIIKGYYFNIKNCSTILQGEPQVDPPYKYKIPSKLARNFFKCQKLYRVVLLNGPALKITSFLKQQSLLDSNVFSTGPPLKQQSPRISWTLIFQHCPPQTTRVQEFLGLSLFNFF